MTNGVKLRGYYKVRILEWWLPCYVRWLAWLFSRTMERFGWKKVIGDQIGWNVTAGMRWGYFDPRSGFEGILLVYDDFAVGDTILTKPEKWLEGTFCWRGVPYAKFRLTRDETASKSSVLSAPC